MNLLIGSGNWSWGIDWLSIDGDPQSAANIIAMVPPLPDRVMRMRFDQIVASHFIEHLTRDEGLLLLQQCYEVLKVGGTLTLEQPNLDYCCQIVLGLIDPPPGRSREQFGLQGILGRPQDHPLMGHKWGYTPQSLADLVVEAGFEKYKISVGAGKYHEPVRDFILEVTR